MVDNKKNRGLGRGLDSLIPKIDDEDEKSKNSSITLEDILSNSNNKEKNGNNEESEEKNKIKNKKEDRDEDKKENKEEKVEEETQETKNKIIQKSSDVEEEKKIEKIEEKVEKEGKIKEITLEENSIEEENLLSDYEIDSIKEVKEIIEKNPRITLWSSKSSAVFRYLRKTRPEFSISKEASELIDEAVSKKYPEIWELFKDI